MPLFQDNITGDGNPLAGASVTIYTDAGALASLFSDMAMSVPLANPLTSDVNGLISCYMANGNYRLVAEKAGYSQRTADIGFFPLLQDNLAGRTVDADFVISVNDRIIWVDAPIDIICTFPVMATISAGALFTVKNKSANRVDFTTPDGKLLNDLNPGDQPLTMEGESMTVSHDSIGWQSVY